MCLQCFFFPKAPTLLISNTTAPPSGRSVSSSENRLTCWRCHQPTSGWWPGSGPPGLNPILDIFFALFTFVFSQILHSGNGTIMARRWTCKCFLCRIIQVTLIFILIVIYNIWSVWVIEWLISFGPVQLVNIWYYWSFLSVMVNTFHSVVQLLTSLEKSSCETYKICIKCFRRK